MPGELAWTVHLAGARVRRRDGAHRPVVRLRPGPQFKLVPTDDLANDADSSIVDGVIGRVIAGRYTIQAHIGGGGMADVYRAVDAELGIDVVIKLLKPELASGDMRARMVQEARAAAQGPPRHQAPRLRPPERISRPGLRAPAPRVRSAATECSRAMRPATTAT